MATRAVLQDTFPPRLIQHWEQVCQKLADLSEAIPASKFDERPVKGVRTVAETLRHVGFWNRYVAAAARGEKGDDQANELPESEFSTKPQIIQVLNSSAAEAADALNENPSGLIAELMEMVLAFIEHNSEHYGQLVVYARLSGIAPAVSREMNHG
jgi:uncharacterized damage-inducible protein DinB